jgi:hypothetical protein
MATTERSDVVFELKEFGDGTPWLMVNFDSPGFSCIKGNDFLGVEFRDGVTFEQANEFRAQLHKMVKGMSFTKL